MEQLKPIKYQWPLVVLSLLILAGIAISGYLTWHHENELYGDSTVSLANCPENATVNCEIVNTSKYSEVFGVPIAVLAIPTYLLLLALIYFRKKYSYSLKLTFLIGLLTTFYSGYLYYVSTVNIGFLCLWCFRLYLINLSIPILSAIALWQNPLLHFRGLNNFFDVKQTTQKFAAGFFSVTLVLTLIAQKTYRANLVKTGKTVKSSESINSDFQANWNPKSFQLPSPLKLLQSNGREVETVSFDLQSKIGQGRSVALFYHVPSYKFSDSTLVETEKYIRENNRNTDFYVIVGRVGEYKIESAWESVKSLPLPKETKILLDEEHSVVKKLGIQESPNLTLIAGDGTLVALRLRHLTASLPEGENITTKEVLAQVDSGQSSPQYKVSPQYYPSQQLMGKCAPNFTLNDVSTGAPYNFSGKSANGKPTLLVFWSATCSHCLKEIPQIVKHHRANSNKYNVVTVSNIRPDRSEGTSQRNITKTYIKNNDLKFPVLVDSGYVNSLFGVTSTPTSFVIAANGTISEGWYYVHSDMDEAVNKALTKANAVKGKCEQYTFPNYSKLQFEMTATGNKNVSMSKLIDRPSLVHFWATWCGPCQEELPSLLAFKSELEKNKGKVHLISVEDQESGEKISSFLSGYGKNIISFRNPVSGLADQLNLGYQVPRTYLLDSTGAILTTFNGAQKWNDPAFKERIYAWLQLSKTERDITSIKQ